MEEKTFARHYDSYKRNPLKQGPGNLRRDPKTGRFLPPIRKPRKPKEESQTDGG